MWKSGQHLFIKFYRFIYLFMKFRIEQKCSEEKPLQMKLFVIAEMTFYFIVKLFSFHFKHRFIQSSSAYQKCWIFIFRYDLLEFYAGNPPFAANASTPTCLIKPWTVSSHACFSISTGLRSVLNPSLILHLFHRETTKATAATELSG